MSHRWNTPRQSFSHLSGIATGTLLLGALFMLLPSGVLAQDHGGIPSGSLSQYHGAMPSGSLSQDREATQPDTLAQEKAQETAVPVGTIELTTADGTRTFQVLEGPMSEGYATGFNQQPVGESMVFGVRLQGWEKGSDDQIMIQTGVFRDSMAQLCDPFSNLIELYPADERSARKRLRPGETPSTTCPDNPVDINITEATFDEADGTLHVKGTFSGPLGRDENATQVSAGRFEASIRSFEDIGSTR